MSEKLNVYDILKARGYLAQVTHEDEVYEYLGKPGNTFYVGFDPTADSLHIGHFIQLMVMRHLQEAGMVPIALMGGGTGYIGDPSGRTDMRSFMDAATIENNVSQFVKQMSTLLDLKDGKGIIVNNADWLLNLNYIDFLREIGRHFSVNRMLTAECYKQRLEKGLSFLEFNYMLMQSYDFLMLSRRYNCLLEVGGDDQWSNILGGVDLIRRLDNKKANGLTFKLLTTSAGVKMGKSAKGAVWLNKNKYSVFDFYQYLRNVDDSDVINLLKLLTFLPLEQIEEFSHVSGAALNEAKRLLAFEVTKLVHGEEEALSADSKAKSLFGSNADTSKAPVIEIAEADLGKSLNDILFIYKLVPSKSEGRRLIQQGGVSIDDQTVKDINFPIDAEKLGAKDGVLLRIGKKKFYNLKAAR